MTAVIDEALDLMQQYTSIWARFAHLSEYKLIIFTVIFALALVAGFYLYRFGFSLIFFMTYATLIAWSLSMITSRQYMLSVVSVTGVIFSFLLFRADRLGANVVSGLAAAGVMLSFGLGPIPAVLAAVAAIVLTVIFPVHSLCVFTSLFGGLGIMGLYDMDLLPGILICLFGIVFQYVTTRKQTVKDVRLPAKIEYYWEKRKADAKRVPQGDQVCDPQN